MAQERSNQASEPNQEELSYYARNLEPDREQTVLICFPGAGYTGLSFAVLAHHLIQRSPSGDLAIVAINYRGHEDCTGDVTDLSLNVLLDDAVAFLDILQRTWTTSHHLLLVGHSLGGSLVTRLVRHQLDIATKVLGIVVIDIVEEAALRALSTMPQVLNNRPSTFTSLSAAIQWARHAHIVRKRESTLISLPSQLTNISSSESESEKYVWRVDLRRCQRHWDGWFRGLSEEFVACPVSRLLVLAEREYLDRPLMIASMQGKFQCSIIRDTGHAIQEDAPEQLANLLVTFVERNLLVYRLNQRRRDHAIINR